MALKAALGDHAYKVAVSSTKSMTGHIMGATGAIETIFCALAIRDQILPPTINYQTPDPDCDLDYMPNQAREAPVEVCLNNAFGFGGHNAVLVIKRYINHKNFSIIDPRRGIWSIRVKTRETSLLFSNTFALLPIP
jgi:3-oxoacyl-[acyl-carrier-protein] synthase II